MITSIAAILVGAVLGFLFHKGRICYAGTLSDFIMFRSSRSGQGILVATLIPLLTWSFFFQYRGLEGFWVPGWGLFSIFGGIIFGFGMILAGSCVTSSLWRAASGRIPYIGVVLGIIGGFFLTGMFTPFMQQWFTVLWIDQGALVYEWFSVPSPVVALGIFTFLVLLYSYVKGYPHYQELEDLDMKESVQRHLQFMYSGFTKFVSEVKSSIPGWSDISYESLRNPWNPVITGIGIGVTVTIWMGLYGVWTVSGPFEGLVVYGVGSVNQAVVGWVPGFLQGYSGTLPIGSITIGGFILGAFSSSLLTGDFGVKAYGEEKLFNYKAIGGGVLMGVGAQLAPGCNVTNLYTGVASLSVHGLVASVGIVIGSYIATKYLFG